ncbi:relaxin-3 [Anolis sagrei]|uniref:relaxin-3 n=1 Tax=Anolis sagrei TaxID=38937 RepID=UPI00352025AA
MGLAWLLLLLLLSHCPFSQEQEEGGEGDVRLCGRDFVRAVVFTCGGSRYRRISPKEDQAPPAQETLGFLQITGDKGQENNNLLSALDPTVNQLQSLRQPAEEPSLKDLLILYDNYIESVPLSDTFTEYIRHTEDVARKRGGETEPDNSNNLNHFPWVKYPRRKRDLEKRLSAICCSLGCNQSLLSRLC